MAYTKNNYIPSANIKVFPCAYRGFDINKQPFDPDARLNTEYNMTHTGRAGKTDSYIISCTFSDQSPSQINEAKFVLGGYYFEITDVVSSTLTNKLLCIKLKSETSNNNNYTTLLDSWEGQSILDQAFDTDSGPDYRFTGLKITPGTDPEEDLGKFKLQLLKADGTVDEKYLLPNVFTGNVETALKLNNESNTAIGVNSIAAGEGTKTSKEAMFTCGQFNKDASDEDNIFEVGIGTNSTNRENGFSVSRTGDTKTKGNAYADGFVSTKGSMSIGGYKMSFPNKTSSIASIENLETEISGMRDSLTSGDLVVGKVDITETNRLVDPDVGSFRPILFKDSAGKIRFHHNFSYDSSTNTLRLYDATDINPSCKLLIGDDAYFTDKDVKGTLFLCRTDNNEKGTLDADLRGTATNATNVTSTINGKTINSIFEETDGTTVKNATNVTSTINNKDINSIFENDGTTVKNATNVDKIKSYRYDSQESQNPVDDGYKDIKTALLNMIYPVGSIYMSVNNVSPQSFLGGTWIRWGQGRVPVGCTESSTTSGKDIIYQTASEQTGGSTKLQSHSHNSGSLTTASAGTHTHDSDNISFTLKEDIVKSGSNARAANGQDAGTITASITIHEAGNHTHQISGNTANAGEGTAENIQPYITCYMWKRTA